MHECYVQSTNTHGFLRGAVNFCMQKFLSIGRIGIFYTAFDHDSYNSSILFRMSIVPDRAFLLQSGEIRKHFSRRNFSPTNLCHTIKCRCQLLTIPCILWCARLEQCGLRTAQPNLVTWPRHIVACPPDNIPMEVLLKTYSDITCGMVIKYSIWPQSERYLVTEPFTI